MRARVDTGVELDYEISGEGEAVLLLHGTGCDRNFWGLQVPAYAENWQVVAVDIRGGGRSDRPSDVTTYSTAAMADDLASLLRDLEVGPAHLSGHSLGSCVAQQIAIRHPAVVRSLQLHATWGHADTWLRRAFIGTTRYPLERGDLQTTFKTVMMWMLSADYLTTWQPDLVAQMVRKCFLDNPDLQANEGMLGHLHADETHDVLGELEAISVPTLVTAGEADYLIPTRYGEQVAGLIPGSLLHIFRGPRSTHASNWELVDEFNRVTTDFMRSV